MSENDGSVLDSTNKRGIRSKRDIASFEASTSITTHLGLNEYAPLDAPFRWIAIDKSMVTDVMTYAKQTIYAKSDVLHAWITIHATKMLTGIKGFHQLKYSRKVNRVSAVGSIGSWVCILISILSVANLLSPIVPFAFAALMMTADTSPALVLLFCCKISFCSNTTASSFPLLLLVLVCKNDDVDDSVSCGQLFDVF